MAEMRYLKPHRRQMAICEARLQLFVMNFMTIYCDIMEIKFPSFIESRVLVNISVPIYIVGTSAQ